MQRFSIDIFLFKNLKLINYLLFKDRLGLVISRIAQFKVLLCGLYWLYRLEQWCALSFD